MSDNEVVELSEVGTSPWAPEPTAGEFRHFMELYGNSDNYFAKAGNVGGVCAAFWLAMAPLLNPQENFLADVVLGAEGTQPRLQDDPCQRQALLQLWFLEEWLNQDDILWAIKKCVQNWHPYVQAPAYRQKIFEREVKVFVLWMKAKKEAAILEAVEQGPLYECSEASAGESETGKSEIGDMEEQEAEPAAASNEPVATAQEAELHLPVPDPDTLPDLAHLSSASEGQ